MKKPIPSSAHTPGPWRLDWLDDDNAWILDSKGNYLFEVVTHDGEGLFVSKDQQIANGRLVAATPTLLTELETQLENWQQLLSGDWVAADNGIRAAINGCANVIAEAKGLLSS